MLTKIEAENLKGHSFSHELSARVAIIGPNFAGKTAIIEAIRLALLGHIPEVGKRASATWELSSGRQMMVCAVFDDGAQIKRTFNEAKGIVAIGSEVFVQAFESLPLLNAEHYFTLTDSQRVQYVFERIKLNEAYTADGIIASLEQLSLDEAHTEPVEKAKRETIALIRKCFEAQPVQEGIAMAVRQLKDQFTYWNGRQKETVAAARVLTELKNREAEVSAVSIADLDIEIKRFENELAELNQQKGKMAAEKAEANRCAGRKQQLEGILAKDRIAYDRVIDRLQTQLDEAKKQIKPVTITDDDVRRHEANGKEIATLKSEIQMLGKQVSDTERRIQEVGKLEHCPYCKASAEGWQARVRAEYETSLTQLRAILTDKTTILEGLDAGDKALGQAITEARDQRNLNDLHERTIDTCTHGIETARRDKEKDDEWRRECQTELDVLKFQKLSADLDAQLATVVQATADVQFALNRVKDSKRKAEELQQDLKRAAQSQMEHIDAKAHVAVIKAVGASLNTIRTGMIDATFSTLLATANSICAGILRSPLAMHEGTIGRWDGHKFIPHRVFSGVEKALAYVSIATALSATAPLKLLLLDEMGRMTANTRMSVLRNISNNIDQGNLDQAIVVIPVDAEDAPFYDGEDWQIISMLP